MKRFPDCCRNAVYYGPANIRAYSPHFPGCISSVTRIYWGTSSYYGDLFAWVPETIRPSEEAHQ